MDSLRRGQCAVAVFTDGMDYKDTCACCNYPRSYAVHKEIAGDIMKVVLIRSPKILAPVLRSIFKIKKIKNEA